MLSEPKLFECPHCRTECRKVLKNGKEVVQDKYYHDRKSNKFIWGLHDCEEFLRD